MNNKMENNPAWKGGVIKNYHGYIELKIPGHPMANCIGYVIRNRLVMSNYFGRNLLQYEQVHHINGIKDDDRIENLQLLTISEHSKLHWDSDAVSRRMIRHRYDTFDSLPEKVIKDKIIRINKDYRVFIGCLCFVCNNLYWKRKDHKGNTCSKSCGLYKSWESGKHTGRWK